MFTNCSRLIPSGKWFSLFLQHPVEALLKIICEGKLYNIWSIYIPFPPPSEPSQRTCEWRPLDYATDEGVRKHFQAAFSSTAAAEEFHNIFTDGQRLAVDSELSENIGKDMDIPEIFSRGEPQK